ncbi:hypothetical protein E2C01_010205 [Portunus trituberculatus]|uniref:Uncharacterized protein n=1 Tax=Portunus trituberculatus TaxID=210409 RepID=A0A5B7D825_PORTR|nr:hypothetical protein [Portunus trituberculatus]
MPLPRRSPRSTPMVAASGVPRSLRPLLQQAKEAINEHQQAIATLQSGMAALGARAAPTPPVSPSAAPENPPARKPLPRVRKPNLHSDRGQDSNPCAWRPLGPQSTHGSTVPRQFATARGGPTHTTSLHTIPTTCRSRKIWL